MAGFEAFDRELQLATAGLDPEAINRELAMFAQRQLRAAIDRGASPLYSMFVNGRPSSSEFEVQAPGPIVYEFSLWEPVITFALDELKRRSPVKSGRFRNSFIVASGNKIVTDYDAISNRAEVIITNFQPYIRKAEAGLLGVGRFAIFDGTKRALSRNFGSAGRNTGAGFRFEARWLTIKSGLHPDIPYTLKGEYANRYNSYRAKLKAGKTKRIPGYFRRKTRDAGEPITYPAVIMSMVF